MQTTDTLSCTLAATIKWAVSIIGLLILSTSWAWDPEPVQNAELKEHLEKWRAHGIADYRMRFQTGDRFGPSNRAIIVDVRNSLVHSASVDSLHSIDSLFIELKEGFRREDSAYTEYGVFFNAKYGYPRDVEHYQYLDEDLVYVDYSIQVKLLTIMEEDAHVVLHETPEEIARTIHDEMVSIPGGTFRMGDLSGAGKGNERPVRVVTVPAFRLGKHEVTYGQWAACLADRGCNGYSPHWIDGGNYNHPIVSVSWNDTQSFIDWLNRKTGGSYRLPSEAEWEYAARAGTTTKYSWGDGIGNNRANCDGCGSQWDDKWTAPVGSFPANAWGLHDMHGNVGEWVQDCANYGYSGAPADGSARTSGNCRQRVIRGGSADGYPGSMRSAARGRDDRMSRYAHGFRLAQDE